VLDYLVIVFRQQKIKNMKRVLIISFFITFALIIASSINKTDKYENIITGFLIFDIFLIFLALFLNIKINKQDEKNFKK